MNENLLKTSTFCLFLVCGEGKNTFFRAIRGVDYVISFAEVMCGAGLHELPFI